MNCWDEYVKAAYQLRLEHRSELVALVKRGLHSAKDAAVAFPVAETIAADEKKEIVPDLLRWCASEKYASMARGLILSISHDWLVENIEIAAEPTLSENDFLDWVNILKLFSEIDTGLARRLAQRMVVHSDSEIREWGEEYLSENEGA